MSEAHRRTMDKATAQERAEEIFRKADLRSLTETEEQDVMAHYQQEILAGLEDPTQSTVKMFRSRLEKAPLNPSSEGKKVLVIELGGTNFYFAQVVIENGVPVLVNHVEGTLPVDANGNPTYPSAHYFYNLLGEEAEDVVTDFDPDAISIVYSFPGDAFPLPEGRGVDVRSPENLPKGFKIPNISAEPVSQALLRVLNELYGLPTDLPVAVLNDTVAVLFAANAKIGGVIGTGYNLAFETPEGIVNSESGGFAIAPNHEFFRAMNQRHADQDDPQKQWAEKQIAGKYLGWQMREVITKLQREGLLSNTYDLKKIFAEDISSYLLNDSQEGDAPILRKAAELLRDRSAKIAALMCVTIFKTFPETFAEQTIDLPIDGSLFWKMPGYKELVVAHIRHLSGKEIRLVQMDEIGRKGAAVAALGYVT